VTPDTAIRFEVMKETTVVTPAASTPAAEPPK
jgi:hypothetical protein